MGVFKIDNWMGTDKGIKWVGWPDHDLLTPKDELTQLEISEKENNV